MTVSNLELFIGSDVIERFLMKLGRSALKLKSKVQILQDELRISIVGAEMVKLFSLSSNPQLHRGYLVYQCDFPNFHGIFIGK